MIKMFKVNPISCIVESKTNQPQCLCGTLEQYESFLVSEYGAERVLREKREEQRRAFFDGMNDGERCAVLIPLALLAIQCKEKDV